MSHCGTKGKTKRSAAAMATVALPMKGTLNQKKAIRLLKENGWTRARGGKHQVRREGDSSWS
jgi:hypothetical protein